MRKYLTRILFIFAAVIFISVTDVAAQKPDEKKGDQRKPPTIVPNEDRKPKNDKDKEKDKDKKPQIVSRIIEGRAQGEV
jgi:hypothetical protein